EQFAGLGPGSVRIIYNGVPDQTLTEVARPSLGPVVGSVGRLDSQKGYDVLIDALRTLPDVTALLVGGGSERDSLERRAADVGVRDRLCITGWQEEARNYLTAMDVFALPSRYEGFPLSVVEAMLAELPVVASAVGSIPEAVVDGETGLLVPPEEPAALGEAIARLIADPDRRKTM